MGQGSAEMGPWDRGGAEMRQGWAYLGTVRQRRGMVGLGIVVAVWAKMGRV
jgi:hypothetical protein